MSVRVSNSDVNVKEENEIKVEEIQKSNGFLYMDMNIYNENDSSSDIEIKEEEITTEDDRLDVDNSSQCLGKFKPEKRIRNKGKMTKGFVVNNENVLGEGGNSENRYKLRARTECKKIKDFSYFEYESVKKKIGSHKRTNTCTSCNVTFSNKTDLINHKAKKTNFKCSYCKKCFCSEQLLVKHNCKLPKSSKNESGLSCDKCGEYFEEKAQLESHLKFHEEAPLSCPKCNEIFGNQTKLDSHILKCRTHIIYTCDICKQTFSQIGRLRKHITTHIKNPNQCQICFVNFETAESLKDHNCNGKPRKGYKTCHLCNKNFLQLSRYKIHLLRHQGILYKCVKCNKSFSSQKLLDNHLTEVDCSLTVMRCEKCGKIYRDGVNFKKHVQTHTDDVMKCASCKKVFVDSSKFSDHLAVADCRKSKETQRKFKYECDECGSKFIKLVKLKIHILNVHHGINYQCHKCNLKFSSQEDRDAHAANQDCKSEDPCTCRTCGKVFAKRDYLKKHQYMHTNVLFKCKYCYCAFMKEKSYKRHMEKMNCSKSARKIRMAEFNFKKCRICEVEFETEELLIAHFGTSHPGQQPHQCFCCDSCLPTFSDLQNHIHHHNIQKYTCNLCGKPYTSQEGFRKHRLKHKGAEFKCKFCESEFLNENRFKFHEKTCKKNPESGYEPSQDKEKLKKKDEKPKQSRQLHWESRIIMKHLRGDPKSTSQQNVGQQESAISSTFFDEPETDSTNKRGWFDNYYKTEEDDIAFGLKKGSEETQQQQDCESDFDVTEFLQTGSIIKKKKTDSKASALVETNPVEDCENEMNGGMDNYPDTSSEESTTDSSEEEEGIEESEPSIDYNPKKCRLCVITFNQEYELLHHFIKAHPGVLAHKCPKCEVQSPLYAQLKEHMKTHGIGIGVFNCDNCSKKFRSEKKMKNHNIRCKGMNADAVALERSAQIFEDSCKRCGKKFHSKFGYRRHKHMCKGKKKNKNSSGPQKLKSETEVDEFITESNDFQVSDTEEVEKDIKQSDSQSKNVCNGKIEQETGPSPSKPPLEEEKKKVEVKDSYAGEPPMDSFPCRLCDKKFQYERGIVMHFKSAHPGNKPLICQVCNMHLADKLKEHLKTHGIGEEFICELCGKRFNQKFLSKIHEMWHQGIEYKCNNCKQKFLNKEKMDKHIAENRCRNRQSLMRLPCDICGKSYRSKFGLGKHYITHTPKELRPVKNRMNCEYCGKWFENNNGLQRHRRIHTGERPFCCRFCPKAFAQEGNCKAHERIHTGESKPRKKKVPPPAPPAPALPPPPPPPPPAPVVLAPSLPVSHVNSMPYPGHINVYVYNNIDSNGIVH